MATRMVCILVVLMSVVTPLGFADAQDDTSLDGIWVNLEVRIAIEIEGNAAKIYTADCMQTFEATLEDGNVVVKEGGLTESFQLTIKGDTMILTDHDGAPVVFHRAESLESVCGGIPSFVLTAEDLMAWADRDVSAVLPYVERHPGPVNFGRGAMTTPVPTYDPTSEEPFQVDLRGFDLSALDLSDSLDNLLYASFDDKTIWPDQMPQDFDWQRIMDLGKEPGLGVRDLHAQGITGKGVGIANIDQVLLVDHQEYVGQLRWYEEMPDLAALGWQAASMHGAAVASISVGQTVGVAPEADLYYIATARGGNENDFTYLAAGIRRILNINQQLPEDRKIRVIAMQVGWSPSDNGYDEVMAAVEEAKAAGMLIICSSTEEVYGFKFHGLGRPPMSDPAVAVSYEPGLFWLEDFVVYPSHEFYSNRLLVPMDSRTTASPTGNEDYVFYREGGWSWAIPYIAGVYALAAQVDPAITPDRFWSLALETGRTIEWEYDGKTIPLGTIIDPVALIEALQS